MQTHLILVEEDLQLPHANSKVSLVELVGDVPSEGAKLPPLLHKGMEEAQTEQEVPPLLLQVEAREERGGECYFIWYMCIRTYTMQSEVYTRAWTYVHTYSISHVHDKIYT